MVTVMSTRPEMEKNETGFRASETCQSARVLLHRSAWNRILKASDAEQETHETRAFLVLPVRIELTTSPLPRARLHQRSYLILRRILLLSASLGADLVLQAA